MNWNHILTGVFFVYLNFGFILISYYGIKRYINDLKTKRRNPIPLIEKILISAVGFIIIAVLVGMFANPVDGKQELFARQFIVFAIPYTFGLIAGFENNKK